jgi:hypothetical protein
MNVSPRSKHHVTVPLPPSTNHLFVTVGKRRVKSMEYRNWLIRAYSRMVELIVPTSYPIEIRVLVSGRVNPNRDLDNVQKALGDSLVASGTIVGDSLKYVTKWVVEYVGGDGEPCADVYLTPRP